MPGVQTRSEKDQSECHSPVLRMPIFLNWPVDDPEVINGDLLDSYHLSQHSLVFWDPLQFACDHGFRTDDRNISVAQYVSYSQKELLEYFSRTKAVSRQLHRLLEDGGIIVIRGNIPRSFIKVKKSTTAGIRDYTEAVTPVFSWLEELIGKYSIHYFHTKALKFMRHDSALADEFQSTPVICLQAVTSVENGKLSVIAATGATMKEGAITRVTFDSVPGQMFFIPQFIVSDEYRNLINAFGRIQTGGVEEAALPEWVSRYESILGEYSPYGTKLNQIEREIQSLTKQKRVLEHEQSVFTRCVNLLFDSGPSLTEVAAEALTKVGFECVNLKSTVRDSWFKLVMKNQSYQRAIVRVVDTVEGPVHVSELQTLSATITETKGTSRPKSILVANSSRSTPPDRRKKWFSDECVALARESDCCLLTTHELFYLVCLVESRRDSELVGTIKTSLIGDILNCDSVFTIDRKKYGV